MIVLATAVNRSASVTAATPPRRMKAWSYGKAVYVRCLDRESKARGRLCDPMDRAGRVGIKRVSEAGRPTLLRDMDEPRRFVSFGAWDDMEQIEAFRHHAEFARHVTRIREALDDFAPVTHEAVIEP